MKKQMATMLAAASISMAIAVPAMAESSHMKTNSTTNQVNETKGHYDSKSYNDSHSGGYSNMSRTRNMNENMYNTNGYNGYGTGTGTYGTNSVNARSTTSHGNWGWLGLLGLFGLAGMRREKHEGKPHHAK
ncbi:WGxxGxxG family protein [Paenibacillus sp. An7]|uniref:WGxxGxxG family protein n=1 Tax=Paenibacillus sp. An7 TaxID=2689577 RepID=UPI001356F827|nr:WGxxGxxG family protein [Paenibacillus sp. An7]